MVSARYVNINPKIQQAIKLINWYALALYDSTEYAAQIGPEILQYYEEYYQVEFPLPKQDMAAMPETSFGGMENWGLITYRESLLLFEPGVSSLVAKDDVLSVVAHELAHSGLEIW